MSKDCIIIGKTNVGKTEFLLNFADYLGLKKLEVSFRQPGGPVLKRTFSLRQARERLVSPQPHKTRCLQTVTISFPAGKGSKGIMLVDSAGITDGIHEEAEVRKAISQTLAAISHAHLILHMVDASEIGKVGLDNALSEFDQQLAHYGAMKGGYALLANKIDLPEGKVGAEILHLENFSPNILPLSAQAKKGFKEVKAFVCRNL